MKPQCYIIDNNIAYIELLNKKGVVTGHAIIDKELIDMAKMLRWSKDAKGYVRNAFGYKLHRYLTNAPDGAEVDHENTNKLDNRLVNLRFCTTTENLGFRNYPNKLNYRGVYKEKYHKYTARFKHQNKTYRIYGFTTAKEAYDAYLKMKETILKAHS